jgi:methionine synthase II (cobalamin-independent)
MVEYFGEQLDGLLLQKMAGYKVTAVDHPLFMVMYRPKAMTVKWAKFAQFITQNGLKECSQVP